MTGSSLAPIVVPIVAVITLAWWLIMVFYADSHPQHGHGTSNREITGGKPAGDPRQQVPRQGAAPDELTDTPSKPAGPAPVRSAGSGSTRRLARAARGD
jgi:hypothetical protein